MKKILALLIVIGLLIGSTFAFAATDRDTSRKFRSFDASTEGLQSCTIYRITGVATGTPGYFGIYNIDTLETASKTYCAVEGGAATAGTSIIMYDFGEEGLKLNSAMTVIVTDCTVVLEYD